MSTVLRKLTVALLPLALAVPVALAAPEVADAHTQAGAPCRRTLPAYPQLDPGDRSEAVRTLQCAINDLGYGPVTVDGYYGPQTKQALAPLVGAREGQPPHPYRITPLFWHQLYGLQLPHRTLAQGDRGPAVRTLQRALRAWGLTVAVDGDFGPQTTAALEDYQRQHHVRPTGRTDRATRYFLVGGDYY
jgi:peptidoglycan hydrolase-like protein with peptidoglycan-binding domain